MFNDIQKENIKRCTATFADLSFGARHNLTIPWSYRVFHDISMAK